MMKHIKIAVMLLMGNAAMFAQTTPKANTQRVETEDPLKVVLPDVNPPSPEAFSFTEYGKNGINEFKGKLNSSIPIYDYSAGQLKTSVSLGYSGAGVKVEDMATWVGINWNLTAGGVITRQIKDGADEGVTERPMINEAHMKANADKACAEDSQYYWLMAYYGSSYNTEVDIFSFSFDGYSGSFYLDGNFNPIYIQNESELRIEIIGTGATNKDKFRNDYTFMITTPTGVKYYFGGSITETTRVLSGGPSMDTDGVTSFYLYKIEHPLNGTILFEYDTLTQKRQDLSKSCSMNAGLDFLGVEYVGVFKDNVFSTRVNNPRKLKKIKSLNNTLEVIFNRTDYDNYNFISVLNSIEVKNTTGNVLLKKINFTYGAKVSPTGTENDFANVSRFFLNKVEIDKELDTEGNESEVYTFEYEDPYSLPHRIKTPGNYTNNPSNSRDFAGYYNGKSNYSILPDEPLINFYSRTNFGNLNPDFNFGKKGTLKKMTYPSKGYSLFEYESGTAKKENIGDYTLSINSFAGNELGTPQTDQIPGYRQDPFGGSIYWNSPNVYKDQELRFTISVNLTSEHGGSALTGKGAELIITNLSTNQQTVFSNIYPFDNDHPFFYSLKKGINYSFHLKFKDNYTTSSAYQGLEAVVNFKIFEGYTPIPGLGIRLKKDMNYSSDNVLAHEKRYYYGTIDGGYAKAELMPDLDIRPKKALEVGDNEGTYYSVTFSSEFMNKYNFSFLDPEVYPVVSISLGGDNFEKGGIEKTFLYAKNTTISRIETIHDGCWNGADYLDIVCGAPNRNANTHLIDVIEYFKMYQENDNSYFNGKLLCERSYVKKDGGLFKIKEQETQYKTEKDFSKKITNFIGCKATQFYRPNYNFCFSDPNDYSSTKTIINGLYGMYFGYYYTYVFNQKTDKVIIKEYIDPVPMSSYFKFNAEKQQYFVLDDPDLIPEELPGPTQETVEASYKKMITTQTYEYGTLRGLPTKVSTVMSDGTTQNSESVYVNQYGTLTGLTTGQTDAYVLMLAQNNIASPIEVKQSDNTETLTKKRTAYKVLSGNKVVPEKIYTAKGTQPIEERATFEEYDSKGNPTLMSLTGGVKIKYLYNANNQVIAKIENFTGTLDPNTNSIANAITFIGQYPNAQVSVFEYEPVTNLLVRMYDPNGKKTTYVYDSMHRLQQIKDNDDNVVKAFDQNFKH
ncbi:RHS repeat protein [Flavobacterium amniphilum]|uniref:RHS repeat domain-containing protein n=1 Tax=Flavobacterium amniphilum TaxID=1834035 RepID=UPI00202A6562|nr:RHS repeat domain-containing protein [Flavobacterium amniphilum]MCL9805463.1 RHS repeat protein [Flavobacterium amniphilum]